MSQIIKDIHNKDVAIGDTILYAKHSELYPANVVKITPKALVITCARGRWAARTAGQDWSDWYKTRTIVADPSGKVMDSRDLAKHNSTKRISRYEQWNNKAETISNQIIKIS